MQADIVSKLRRLVVELEAAPPEQLNLFRSASAVALTGLRDRLLGEVYIVGQRRRETIRVVRHHWSAIVGLLGPIAVDEVDRTHALAVLRAWSNKPPTANARLNALSAGLTWAERWGLRPPGSNPCKAVARLQIKRPARRFSTKQVQALLDALVALEQDGRSACLLLQFAVGARPGEIRRLRWDEVDLGGRLIRIQTKTKELHTIPLSEFALGVLARRPRQSEWVFPLPGDPTRHLGRGDDHWRKVVELAGMPGTRRHDLRHAFATMAARSGRTLAQIGEVLGHSSQYMTEVYTHLDIDDARETVESVAGAVEVRCG